MNKYENGNHIIYCADAIEILKNEIKSHSVDLVFADPPYNIGKQFSRFSDKWVSEEQYAAWAYAWLGECIRVLKPGGSMYVMASTQAMPYVDIFLRSKLTVLSRIVWCYDSSGMQAKRHYGSLYEPILFCVQDKNRYTFNSSSILIEAKTGAQRNLIDYRKSEPKKYNEKKIPGNVWYIPRVRYRMGEYENHPSQKPEALLERIILASSNEGDVVLDPFSGTFTTAAVAGKHNRKSISIENQKEYLKIGLRRILNAKELDSELLNPFAKQFARKNRRITGIQRMRVM